MDIKISIIVPIFNSENYLSRCIESLIHQSLKEIEIILVNDCSIDNSLSIAEEYKNKYSHLIKLINNETRRGPGGARNAGIKAANGKYIGFVDSDDDVFYTMYEELYEKAVKNDYDMIDSAFYYEALEEDFLTTSEAACGTLDIAKRKDLMLHGGFIWSKIIKREIIIDNNILFRENTAYEDIDFIRNVMLCCNNIGAINSVLYNYRDTSTSISGCEDIEVQIYEKISSIKSLITMLNKMNQYEIYMNEVKYLAVKTYNALNDYVYSMTEQPDNKILKVIDAFKRNYCS